jgi:hypothetical protein
MFPLFGIWLTELQGIAMLGIASLCSVFLACALLGLRAWAWWAALVYYVALTSSLVLTLCLSSYPELLSTMRFPPTEMEILGGLPLQGFHLAIFFGLPLLATLGLLVHAKRYFGAGRPVVGSKVETNGWLDTQA